MQKQYHHLYALLTKRMTVPSRCLPFSRSFKNIDSLKDLIKINQSISEAINSDNMPNKTSRKSLKKPLTFQQNNHTTIIHNNFRHFSQLKTTRMQTKHHNKLDNEQNCKQNLASIQSKKHKSKQTKRKDLYDEHIQKYMNMKYENAEIIQKYLQNRDEFIKEACLEIQNQLRRKSSLNKLKRKNMKKYQSQLPKIQQLSYKLKKSINYNKNGHYLQQINQIKKAEELQLKNRKRQQRVFRKKMNSLQSKLNYLHMINQQ